MRQEDESEEHPVQLQKEVEDNHLNFVFIKKNYLQEQRSSRKELSDVYSQVYKENDDLQSECERLKELVANSGMHSNEQDMEAKNQNLKELMK